MPFGLQPVHLILIVVIALLIFGPARLSNLGRRLGKSLVDHLQGPREVNSGTQEKIVGVCSFCGTTNPPLSRYCSKCGISLTK